MLNVLCCLKRCKIWELKTITYSVYHISFKDLNNVSNSRNRIFLVIFSELLWVTSNLLSRPSFDFIMYHFPILAMFSDSIKKCLMLFSCPRYGILVASWWLNSGRRFMSSRHWRSFGRVERPILSFFFRFLLAFSLH